MRSETITESVTVVWRDERKGRSTVNNIAQVQALLSHFELPSTVAIERKPNGTVQEAAWAYAENSGMARIVMEDNERRVRFLDEDRFVLFSRLALDPAIGFPIMESDQ